MAYLEKDLFTSVNDINSPKKLFFIGLIMVINYSISMKQTLKCGGEYAKFYKTAVCICNDAVFLISNSSVAQALYIRWRGWSIFNF